MERQEQQNTFRKLVESIRTTNGDANIDQKAVQVVERLASHLTSGPSNQTRLEDSARSSAAQMRREMDPALKQLAAQRIALMRLSRNLPVAADLLKASAGGKDLEGVLNNAQQDGYLCGLVDPPRPSGGLAETRKRIKDSMQAKLEARRQELREIPDARPNEVRVNALIEQKKVKLAELQRQVRRWTCSENWLRNNANLDCLMEWSHLRKPLPDANLQEIPNYRHCPPYPLMQNRRLDEELIEIGRLRRYDDDTRRTYIYHQVNSMRLGRARQVVEKEKSQRKEAERIHRLEQDMKLRAIKQRRAFLDEVLASGREFRNLGANAARRRAQRNSGVRQWHNRALKNMSRLAADRVRALKDHDYAKYLELARNAKDTRFKELMKKTDDIIIELSLKVQDQRKEVVRPDEDDGDHAMNSSDFASVLHSTEDDSDRFLKGHLNYYNMVHQCKEHIKEQPKMLVGGSVRGYQLDGLRFLISLHNNRLNGILADEMGLGKTIQTIALLCYLMESKNNNGPHLIIAPKAVLHNWVREFEKWAPKMNVVMYDGTAEERKARRQEQIEGGSFNVLVTHYDLIIRDKGMFKKMSWEHLIVDEGHRLKNSESKLFDILRDQKSRCRLLLTGTPIQNSLSELWALLNFLLPKVFNCSETFDEWFAAPFKGAREDVSSQLRDEEQLLVINRLHQVIRPFMLRRTKREVEKELPSKIEVIIKCDLSAWQRIYYKQISEKAHVRRDGKVRHLNNISMHMRKACNHPYLFLDRGAYEPQDKEELIRASGKIELLNRVLPKLKQSGHRVLLFSQMTQALNIIEEFLEMKGFNYFRLDGGTKTDDRRDMLDAFNDPDSEVFVFMLSTRAGGLGLNLQTADTVIMFDSDWNPAMDLQAEDRAHRIGQKSDVLVLVLVSSGTIEEVILERAHEKRDLDAKVIQAGMFNDKSTHTERQKVLKDILTKGDTLVGGEVSGEQEVNELIARNREEFILFEKMDKENRLQNGNRTRLMTEDELPSWVIEDEEEPSEKETISSSDGGRKKRRQRRVQRISYRDSSSSSETSSSESEDDIPLSRRTGKRKAAEPATSFQDDGDASSKRQRLAEGRQQRTAKRGGRAARGRRGRSTDMSRGSSANRAEADDDGGEASSKSSRGSKGRARGKRRLSQS